jgi:DNA-binding transcriptional ArsR family regulator
MVNQIDQAFDALAQPTRRRVVELLLERPRSAGELAAASSMSSPAMSKHLRILRRSGLVREEPSERDARVRVYSLRPEPFMTLGDWLAEVQAFWNEQLDSFKDSTDKRAEGEGDGSDQH